jgi:hypothetical protein
VEIHLDDCSDLWEEYIQEATNSIVVFTPYFDRILVDLFSECSLPYEDIYLITQLDRVDSNSENLTRLDRIVELMGLGVNVRVLDRLHAKVLIVDDQDAFFGSQNFTKYSTESIEITTQIDRTDDFDEFFDYFTKLQFLSREVTLEELNEASGSTRYKTSDESDEDEDEEDEEDDFNRI